MTPPPKRGNTGRPAYLRTTAPQPGGRPFSERSLKMLDLLKAGKPTRAIARELGVPQSNVKIIKLRAQRRGLLSDGVEPVIEQPAAAPPPPPAPAWDWPPMPALAVAAAPPIAPAATSTGVACRVCGVDDGDERVQPNLHRRCVEGAIRAVKRRKKPARAPRSHVAPDVGAPLSHAELVQRLAADRAARVAPAPAGKRRGPKPRLRDREDDEAPGPLFHGDQLDAGADVAIAGLGLSTSGLGDA